MLILLQLLLCVKYIIVSALYVRPHLDHEVDPIISIL